MSVRIIIGDARMIQSRPDAQVSLAYSVEDLRVIANAAVIRMERAACLPTQEAREAAITDLLNAAPSFVRKNALRNAAVYLLIERGL